MYMYIYTYTYIHVHIHTYTHTHTRPWIYAQSHTRIDRQALRYFASCWIAPPPALSPPYLFIHKSGGAAAPHCSEDKALLRRIMAQWLDDALLAKCTKEVSCMHMLQACSCSCSCLPLCALCLCVVISALTLGYA